MSADLATQKAIYDRLVATAAVTSLVPAASIRDRNQRPAPDPSIIIGEGQTMEGNQIDRHDQRVFLDLHLFKKEEGLRGVKAIAGAVRAALHSLGLPPTAEHHFTDCRVTSMRFIRDPDGETAHGVVAVETLVIEVA